MAPGDLLWVPGVRSLTVDYVEYSATRFCILCARIGWSGTVLLLCAATAEVLGSHFAGNGAVNGWQSMAAFFTTELAVVVLAAVVGFGIPRIIGAMPVSLINLPNKEFWLSPERRAETLSYLQMHMAWFG